MEYWFIGLEKLRGTPHYSFQQIGTLVFKRGHKVRTRRYKYLLFL